MSDTGRGERHNASDLEKRVAANVVADREAVNVLRDTARWIVGGVALASGGIVAGSSLSSLGSLGLELRLLVAACAAVAGLAALAWLLWTAVDVLTPRIYDLQGLFTGQTISPPEFELILQRVQRLLPVGTGAIRELARRYDSAQRQIAAVDEEEVDALRLLLDIAISGIRFEHSRLMFLNLKLRLFALTPVVAVSFGIFAWAANPPKEDTTDVIPMLKEVDLVASDQPAPVVPQEVV